MAMCCEKKFLGYIAKIKSSVVFIEWEVQTNRAEQHLEKRKELINYPNPQT